MAEAGPGDFIFVPRYVPHQEINADPTQTLECVLVRSDNEALVVDITDVEPVEKPEVVLLGRSDPSTAVRSILRLDSSRGIATPTDSFAGLSIDYSITP